MNTSSNRVKKCGISPLDPSLCSFFLQDSSCFPALNAPPHLGWGFETMFFQAWAPKSWELHLMQSCQSTVDVEVWSVADGSGVRSRMYGIPEVWEPFTSVCFDEGWCGSLESKERAIYPACLWWGVKVCRFSWELQREGSRISQVSPWRQNPPGLWSCSVILMCFSWAGCLKPAWHPMALGKCGCPSSPASLVTEMDVLLL